MTYFEPLLLIVVLFFLGQAFHHFYTRRPKLGAFFTLVSALVWAGFLA